MYKFVATIAGLPQRTYLIKTEGDFKRRCYNHKMSFTKESHAKDTSLSKEVWESKEKSDIAPDLNGQM